MLSSKPTKRPHVVLLKNHIRGKGGLEKYTLKLAEAFRQKECRVTLLTTGEVEGLPCDAISFGTPKGFGYRKLIKFDDECQDWIKFNRPDVVFGMDRNTYQTHYRAGNGVHAEYLEKRKRVSSFLKNVSFCLNPLHRAILSFEKSTYENRDLKALFTNSHMVKSEILKHYDADGQKIHVVHNGVEWKEMERHVSFRTDLNAPHEFLFVGHEYHRKGLDKLLRALSPIRDLYHLTVIGKERNLRYYEEMAEELKVNATFLGAQSPVTPYYQKADTLVHPSLYDPFANVTVEALAMGLFVITSPFNGGKEVLQDETGSVLRSLEDPLHFTEVLKTAMEKPKTEERAMAIRQSVSHLDFRNQLDQITTLTLSHAC